jgi:hypothetical protein
MSTVLTIGLVGGAVVFTLAALLGARRRGRSNDLGSVSRTWTVEHTAGYRGGDDSRG